MSSDSKAKRRQRPIRHFSAEELELARQLDEQTKGERRRIHSALFALGLVAFVACLAWMRSVGRNSGVDIEFDDETMYLSSGLELLRKGLPDASWAPIYSIWYWLESLFVPDALSLYFFNWSALLAANLLLLGMVLRKLAVSPAVIAVVLAAMASLEYFETEPYVPLLASALVLLAIRVGLSRSTLPQALSATAAVMGLALFVRPELATSVLILLVGTAIASYRAGGWRAAARSILLPGATCVLLLAIFGNPLGTARSFFAFNQHYALNLNKAGLSTVDPWTNAGKFATRDFGAAKSILGALKANPQAFVWHVRMNLASAADPLKIFRPYSTLLGRDAKIIFAWCLLGALLAGSVLAALHVFKSRSGRSPLSSQTGMFLAVMFLAVLLPALISGAIIHPRLHYFIVPTAALLPLACLGIALAMRQVGPVSSRSLILGAAFGAASLAPLPAFLTNWTWSRDSAPGSLMVGGEHAATIAYLRQLRPPARAPVSILESDFGRLVYVGWVHRSIASSDCQPFSACVEKEQPGVIVSDPRLRAFYGWQQDPGLPAFEKTPMSLGYSAIPVSGTEVVIYSRL